MSTKKSILLLLGISILVYFKWLLRGIYTNSDWWYATSTFLHNYFNPPYIWSSTSSLGSVDLIAWRLPVNFLYGLLSFLNFDSSVSDRILVFWPTIILGNIAIYFLVKKITKSSIAGVVGALVFNYNTYFFISQTAFLLYAGAVWLVITLLGFIYTIEKKSITISILSGLSLFISGAYDFRMAYLSVFMLITYYLFYTIFISKEKLLKALARNVYLLLIVFSIFSVLNLYWVLPLIFSKKFASNVILQRGLFGNEFLNMLYAITMSHPFWTGGQPAIFDPQSIIPYFWIIPIIAFLGLLFGRNNKNILFFGLISFLGIFLTKQVGQPFSNFYIYLFQHLPGFNAFREATKFYVIIALGFSVLVGGFAGVVYRKFSPKSKNFYGYLFIILLVILFVINTLPFINGELGMSRPHVVPEDYKSLGRFILNDKDFSRSLWVPAFSRWGPGDYIHTILQGVDLINNNWSAFFLKNGNSYMYDDGTLLINSFHKPFTKNLLSSTSVKYVILPLEDLKNDDDFFVFYGKKRSFYLDELNKISYLKRVNAGTKDIVVYENPSYRPHIYETTLKETIYKDIPYQKINFTYINPTKYIIELQNVSKPFYLNFTDSFNPNWELRLGDFHWFDALIKENYFLSVNHFASDAGLNSFFVDPGIVCKIEVNGCTKNADGSYSMHLTLYFKPQSYLYLGLIISGLTLLGVIGSLVFFGIKEIKDYGKKN